MAATTPDPHNAFERGLFELRALRDELRVRIHLAGQEAKDAWRELEPKVEDLLEQATKSAHHATDELLKKAREIDGRIAKS